MLPKLMVINGGKYMDNYNYPVGADTPDAPWNQVDNPEKEIEVTVSVTLSKTVRINVSDYEITDSEIYNSPTDMGVNMVGNCIINDEVVRLASKKEIVRRYFNEMTNYKKGLVDIDVPEKIKLLMNELGIDEKIFKTVEVARKKSKEKKNMKKDIKNY